MSQGGAISIVYAARHPERVSHLVLCGAFARGPLRRSPSPQQVEATEAMIKLVEFGWGQSNPAFLQMFTSQFFPAGDARAGALVQRDPAPRRLAARGGAADSRLRRARRIGRVGAGAGADPCLSQPRRQPGAVRRGSLRRDLDRRRALRAARQQQPRALAGRAGIRSACSTTWCAFVPPARGERAPFAELTRREREVLEQIARGLDNAQIAAQLESGRKDGAQPHHGHLRQDRGREPLAGDRRARASPVSAA